MIRILLPLLLLCLSLTGCVKQDILEKTTISFVSAFDEAPGDQLELTLAPPKFQAGKSRTVSNLLLSKVGHTSRSITELMNMQLNRPIKTGKISVVLIGKAVAAKGISNELDVLLRDALASRKMYVAIVDGEAKKVLQTNFSSNLEKGMYLFDLLDTNVRTGLVPRANLNDFEYAYLGKGMDPFLPILGLRGDQAVISGLALFKDDRYVSSLNEQQMRVVKLLRENAKYGVLEARLQDGTYFAVKNVGSKVKYRVSRDKNRPSLLITLRLNAEVIDSKGIRLTGLEHRRFQDSLEKELGTTGTGLIRQFQKDGIDPLGLGDIVRSKTRHWSEAAWKQAYPAANVSLKVHVVLTETGIRK